jgi:hypothetical protein
MKHTVYAAESGGGWQEDIVPAVEIHSLDEVPAIDTDVIHTHGSRYPDGPEGAGEWWQNTAIPTVFTRHWLDEGPRLVGGGNPARYTQVWTWDKTDGSLCIPNGIDYCSLPDYDWTPKNQQYIITTGCSERFIETCELLRSEHPKDYKFFCVGNQQDAPGWMVSIPAHNTAILLGALNMCDTLLLPSPEEAAPLVLMEARGMGLSCVAADVGGISTICGVTVLPQTATPARWAEDVQRAVGRHAYSRPPEHDGKIMVKRYGWLYRSMTLRDMEA